MTATNYMNMMNEKSELNAMVKDFFYGAAGGQDVPAEVTEAEARIEAIEEEVKAIPTVKVQYYIGYRQYFDSVIKIGKSYFDRGTKMTASRGYRSITEIDEITEEMERRMTADSHWY
jgi:hypothetical protein